MGWFSAKDPLDDWYDAQDGCSPLEAGDDDEDEVNEAKPLCDVVRIGDAPTAGDKVRNRLAKIVVLLYYSSVTAPIYGAVFILAALLLLTTLGFHTPLAGKTKVVILMEVCVTMSLIIEVVMKYSILGRLFLMSWLGILDILVAATSATFLFLEAPLARFKVNRAEDIELSQSLVMLRILIHFGRLLVLAERTERARRVKSKNSAKEALQFNFSVLRENELRKRQRAGEEFL